jgi:hypothetical protein
MASVPRVKSTNKYVIYSLKLLAKSLTYKVWDLTYSVEAFRFSKGLKPPQGLVQQTGPRDTAKTRQQYNTLRSAVKTFV